MKRSHVLMFITVMIVFSVTVGCGKKSNTNTNPTTPQQPVSPVNPNNPVLPGSPQSGFSLPPGYTDQQFYQNYFCNFPQNIYYYNQQYSGCDYYNMINRQYQQYGQGQRFSDFMYQDPYNMNNSCYYDRYGQVQCLNYVMPGIQDRYLRPGYNTQGGYIYYNDTPYGTDLNIGWN